MRFSMMYLAGGVLGQQLLLAVAAPSSPHPTPFSSNFHQPSPPLVQPEFKANWNQHKWNENVSHIASGYIYNSPSQKKVRVDEAYDGALGSSLFDYSNVTEQGVANIQWLLEPSIASTPHFFVGYVEPAFPLIPSDLLEAGRAVYAGVVHDPYVGAMTAWNILYASQLPTTVLVDEAHVIHGYDYWNPNERTYAITRFFNIVIGKLPKDLFEFPQPTSKTTAL